MKIKRVEAGDPPPFPLLRVGRYLSTSARVLRFLRTAVTILQDSRFKRQISEPLGTETNIILFLFYFKRYFHFPTGVKSNTVSHLISRSSSSDPGRSWSFFCHCIAGRGG